MNTLRSETLLSKPRWDGSRLLFSVEVDGEPVPCAISRAALQDLCEISYLRDGDLLRAFAQVRERIAAIAVGIVRVRPDNVTGRLSIWASDIGDPPAAPAVSCRMERHGRA